MKFIYPFTALFLLVILVSSCKKDDILTDSSAKLEFSEDTVLFDTVFTSLGSTTRQLKLYNRKDQPIRVSSIRLAGGAPSMYRLNVDGIAGKDFYDVEIPAKDSLYIFIEVTVNPSNPDIGYILQDSIVFITNGNQQDIDLVAFGQNANFIIADQLLKAGNSFISYALLDTNLNATVTWDNALPYVIWGGYAVVDSSQTLNILAGTKIYFANNSGLWVYRGGTLNVAGTETEKVVFQGIRLESYYQDIPGQWDRIWINEGSINNVINYAEIRNGFIGIQAESLIDTLDPKNLEITNTIIQNMSGFGIFSRYYNIQAKNTVISRCGQYAVALTQGGGYEFKHCTIANYWSGSQRSTPSLYMNDYAQDQAENFYEFPLYQADFLNCIIWGNNDEELEIDYQFASDSHQFRNVLLKTELDVTTPNFSNILLNLNPVFVDFQDNDYQLQATSPARDAGDPGVVSDDPTDLTLDIKGIDRTASPDLGAYEFQ
ncbi:MAG: hypothetical protein M3Q95_09510 [Bacteroidota bacterium]|nr:hypothetical protein [Bacteroidota bacterium]